MAKRNPEYFREYRARNKREAEGQEQEQHQEQEQEQVAAPVPRRRVVAKQPKAHWPHAHPEPGVGHEDPQPRTARAVEAQEDEEAEEQPAPRLNPKRQRRCPQGAASALQQQQQQQQQQQLPQPLPLPLPALVPVSWGLGTCPPPPSCAGGLPLLPLTLCNDPDEETMDEAAVLQLGQDLGAAGDTHMEAAHGEEAEASYHHTLQRSHLPAYGGQAARAAAYLHPLQGQPQQPMQHAAQQQLRPLPPANAAAPAASPASPAFVPPSLAWPRLPFTAGPEAEALRQRAGLFSAWAGEAGLGAEGGGGEALLLAAGSPLATPHGGLAAFPPAAPYSGCGLRGAMTAPAFTPAPAPSCVSVCVSGSWCHLPALCGGLGAQVQPPPSSSARRAAHVAAAVAEAAAGQWGPMGYRWA